jgi:2-polyprenyl-6-hydroxyphenyl methylase/3-demethylubiquinone-9 3-methyltransferase
MAKYGVLGQDVSLGANCGDFSLSPLPNHLLEHMANINNDFYEKLGDQWTSEQSHPVALLRAENRVRNPWIAARLKPKSKVLDIGCGAGFLTNDLAERGHAVTGIDLSEKSLEVARKTDVTKSVIYENASATALPYLDDSFDVVCAMDLLEHVTEPEKVVSESARVLKPGGLFFFHTFNRNFLSYIIVIKGVEWFVKNTPPNMHVYPLFIKPKELIQMGKSCGLVLSQIHGLAPNWRKWPFWRMLFTRTVPPDLTFTITPSLVTGYFGFFAKK